MGYMRHHAIVVTGMDLRHDVSRAHVRAREIFGEDCSDLLPEVTNGYRSFFVGPDGSKEGWDESDEGNKRRASFIAWLRDNGACDWAEVRFGDDDYQNCLEQASGGLAEPGKGG